jgi:histidine ammonia-lyase
VLEDALNFFKGMIEIELNGSNDNPLFDVEAGKVCHGGHFYGGHIAFAMDSIKCQVANLADLMDRQMALLANPTYNNGLPANLSGMTGPKACINFGLKGLEVVTSGWTGEALKNCMPASVFSRSTENHVQDKVSMGTIAARDCVRVLDLVEQVAAALLIAVRQGIVLRQKLSGPSLKLSQDANKFLQELTSDVEFITADVFLEPTLRALTGKIKNRSWNLYD